MYKTILVPVDPSHGEVARHILTVARHLAGAEGWITVLSVIEPVPAYVASQIPEDVLAENRDAAKARVEELANGAGLKGHVVLREGSPAVEILAEAEKMDADAIILGSHRPDYTDYFLGSTAARVVRHARCTVVVERSAVTP